MIALLVVLPSVAKGPRYRPGASWWAAPVWFNGPDQHPAAAGATRVPIDAPAGTPADGSGAVTTGGTSARW